LGLHQNLLKDTEDEEEKGLKIKKNYYVAKKKAKK